MSNILPTKRLGTIFLADAYMANLSSIDPTRDATGQRLHCGRGLAQSVVPRFARRGFDLRSWPKERER